MNVIGKLCKKAGVPPWLLSAGIGAGGGGLLGYLLDDDGGWDNTLIGAATGGLAGLAVSPFLPTDVGKIIEPKIDSWESIAPADKKDPVSKKIDAAARRRSSRVALHEKYNLTNVLTPYYKNVPGGLDEAIRKAEEARRRNIAEGFDTSKYTENPELGRLKQVLEQPKRIRTYPHDFDPLLGGVLGHYDTNTGKVFLSSKASWKQFPQRAAMEHEMTHAALIGKKPTEQVKRKATRLLDEIKRKNPGITTDAYDEYVLRGVEIDPRLAAIKRMYAEATGKLVDTPAEAKKALEFFKKRYGGVISMMGFDPRGDYDLGDVYRYMYGEPSDHPVKPKQTKTLLDYILRRMPELVKNTGNEGAA